MGAEKSQQLLPLPARRQGFELLFRAGYFQVGGQITQDDPNGQGRRTGPSLQLRSAFQMSSGHQEGQVVDEHTLTASGITQKDQSFGAGGGLLRAQRATVSVAEIG